MKKALFPGLMFFMLIQISGCKEKQEEIIIENDKLSVRIIPLGAELQSIYGKRSNTEYLWQGDSAYWAYRSPVMFPVNVRFRDNRFTYKGAMYEIPSVGLARIYRFKAIPGNDKTSVTFEMTADSSTLPSYPFLFRFTVTYTVAGNRLNVQYVVENKGSDTMFYATGGHPGFNIPLTDGTGRGDYQLIFSDTMTVYRNVIAGGLVQTTELPLLENEKAFLLNDPRIPQNTGMFVKNMPSRIIGVGRVGQPPYLSVDLGDFPNVNVWSPEGFPFLCIEPMVSHHDIEDSPMEIEKKNFLIRQAPGESRAYSYSIILNE